MGCVLQGFPAAGLARHPGWAVAGLCPGNGRVRGNADGRGAVNAEVVLDLDGGGSIAATITLDSLKSLGLAEGKRATDIFKASSVILGQFVRAPNHWTLS